MNFNFHEFRKPRIQRLFIPRNAFSFAAFMVPIKFRQPVPARVFAFQRRVGPFSSHSGRLDGPAN
jgi:hypothetical protein